MFPQLLWLIDLFFTVRERGNYHHYGGWLTFTLSSHSQPTFFFSQHEKQMPLCQRLYNCHCIQYSDQC